MMGSQQEPHIPKKIRIPIYGALPSIVICITGQDHLSTVSIVTNYIGSVIEALCLIALLH